MACFAGFLVGREAAKVMLPRNRGTIIFTGATASVRGSADFKERVTSPAVKEKLRCNTEEAVRAGVFGCPTIMVRETLFFGQGPSDFVRETLSSR